jgi:hypothetical protein
VQVPIPKVIEEITEYSKTNRPNIPIARNTSETFMILQPGWKDPSQIKTFARAPVLRFTSSKGLHYVVQVVVTPVSPASQLAAAGPQNDSSEPVVKLGVALVWSVYDRDVKSSDAWLGN